MKRGKTSSAVGTGRTTGRERVGFGRSLLLLIGFALVFSSAQLFSGEPAMRIIGRSVEGRPIEAYRFGPDPREKASGTVLIYGGIHGGYEWNTVALTRRLIEHFSSAPNESPKGIRLYIIPVLNPDGLHRVTGGRPLEEVDFSSAELEKGRLNANGVDLNRNWDNRWEPVAYWRSREVDAGEHPFSEPETRALRDFVEEIEPELIISYHSAANGIYYAGKRDRWEPALRFARIYSDASGYPIPDRSLVGYRITGASTGYFYKLGIPAMVIELKGREGPEYEQNLAGVRGVVRAQWFKSWGKANRHSPSANPCPL